MTRQRHFLFLQGPHGPFFRQLARKLAATGSQVSRIGATFGDRIFWHRNLPYIGYDGTIDSWATYLKDYITANQITDIVLYGDSRPFHKIARAVANDLNITAHCFEEGYLRPYWITYERGGTNGNSPIMQMSVAQMQEMVSDHHADLPEIPVMWGAIWHHAFYGFLYHLCVALPIPRYRRYQPHRNIGVLKELYLYIRRLLVMPVHGLQRRIRTRRLLRSGSVYHLVLLQLSHDASLRSHSDLTSVGEFIRFTIAEFANGAPQHHLLAFKAHPFEDWREPLTREVRRAARANKVSDRVRFVPGGKLGPLLDAANSVVTVNSTASQQALWRALPVWVQGRSVFAKPEFVSQQPLRDFFANPDHPDWEAYHDYRLFLLETSQVGGGFYTQRGRAQTLRRLVDMMLSEHSPYEHVTLQPKISQKTN